MTDDAASGHRRVAVVTGATSGVGRATARALAGLGWQLVLVARNPSRADATAAELRSSGALVETVIADLSLSTEVRRAAGEIAAHHPSIDLLVNNAGAVYMRRAVTPEGHERTFALNVLAPYLLARLLEPNLRAAGGGARVVHVASEAHRGGRFSLENLESEPPYHGYGAYSRSKVALILLAREFGARVPPTAVVHVAVHPGFVRSRFGLDNGGGFALLLRLLGIFAISPERAARVLLYAATAPELARSRGAYVVRERVVEPAASARDAPTGARLWAELAQQTGLPA